MKEDQKKAVINFLQSIGCLILFVLFISLILKSCGTLIGTFGF